MGDGKMKLSWIVLGLLLVLCAILAALFIIGEAPVKLNAPHPDYPDMLQGNPGIESQSHIKWLGYALAITQFCFIAALILFSLNKQGRLKKLKTPLLIATALCITAFCLIMAAYWAFARQGSGDLFGGFPLPTALMLYALWPMQILFVIIYVMYYDKAIFTPEDADKFQAILNSQNEDAKEIADGS
jgi:hypothetical protein